MGIHIQHLAQTARFLIIIFSSIFLLLSFPVYAITSSPSTLVFSHNTHSADADYQKGYRYETGKRVTKNTKKAIKWYKRAANKSHPKAQYRLGILYYQQKIYKKAKYWLQKRAKAGEADAQYHYANILRYGLGTKQQTSIARKWYLKAAKKNHKQAQYELALLYKNGIGAKKNIATARKWFKKAAKQKHKQAKLALKQLPKENVSARSKKQATTPKNKQTVQQRFLSKNLKRAKAGNKQAQYKLGKAYKTGKNAPKNTKKALKWLTKAAKSNHTEAQYQLANFYFEGAKGLRKDLDKAKYWYVKAADSDHKKANKKLNKIAKLSLKEQQSRRFDKMITAALQGDAKQQYGIGMRYLLAYKTEPDSEQAYYWLYEAAKQHHPLALYQLGNEYIRGAIVKKDIRKAIHYFTAAARQKVPAAQTAIKLYTENGYKKRVNAENGDKVAQLSLAQFYLNKNSMTDKNEGLKWLKASAKQSYPAALIALAKVYEAGELMPKNYQKAFTAYQAAANLNNAKAQYQVGRMYQSGIGTKLNQQLAYRWFEKAASQGLREAEQALQFSGL